MGQLYRLLGSAQVGGLLEKYGDVEHLGNKPAGDSCLLVEWNIYWKIRSGMLQV